MFLPLALFGIVLAWRRWGDPLSPPPNIVIASLEIAFAIALTLTAWLTLIANDYFHLRLNQFFQYPLLAVPLLPAALAAMLGLGGQASGLADLAPPCFRA